MAATFGECCRDLRDSMAREDFESTFRVNENGVLYMTVGASGTGRNRVLTGMAVRYCPFCGTQIQTVEGIARAGETMN